MIILLVWVLLVLLVDSSSANIRCYTCSPPCTEFDWFAYNYDKFERDCLLDRSCMKATRHLEL